MNKISDVDAAWLAAAIDADGSISLCKQRKNSFYTRIGLYNDCEAYCRKAQSVISFGSVNKRANSKHWNYILQDRYIVKDILDKILPYLIVKKENAQLVLKFIETNVAVPTISIKGRKSGNPSPNDYKKGRRMTSEEARRTAACARNHHLKGRRMTSDEARKTALAVKNNHLKGNRTLRKGNSKGKSLEFIKANLETIEKSDSRKQA
jgi:hypothetical protein